MAEDINPNNKRLARPDPFERHDVTGEPASEPKYVRKTLTHMEYWAQRRDEGVTQEEIDAARRSLQPLVPMENSDDFAGISEDEFAKVPEELLRPVSQVDQPPLPTWFKALGVAVMALPLLFVAGKSYYDSYENIKDQDWQKFMSESCRPTLHGRLKTFFYDELHMWSHINASMNSWERSAKGDSRICDIDHADPSQLVKELQCHAFHETKTDWHARCKPVVLLSCQGSGGACR